MHEPFHMYEFDMESFRQLARRLDFEIVVHRYACVQYLSYS